MVISAAFSLRSGASAGISTATPTCMRRAVDRAADQHRLVERAAHVGPQAGGRERLLVALGDRTRSAGRARAVAAARSCSGTARAARPARRPRATRPARGRSRPSMYRWPPRAACASHSSAERRRRARVAALGALERPGHDASRSRARRRARSCRRRRRRTTRAAAARARRRGAPRASAARSARRAVSRGRGDTRSRTAGRSTSTAAWSPAQIAIARARLVARAEVQARRRRASRWLAIIASRRAARARESPTLASASASARRDARCADASISRSLQRASARSPKRARPRARRARPASRRSRRRPSGQAIDRLVGIGRIRPRQLERTCELRRAAASRSPRRRWKCARASWHTAASPRARPRAARSGRPAAARRSGRAPWHG